MKSNNFISVLNDEIYDNLETKIVINDKEFPFNSFVANFRDALFKILNPSDTVTIKNLANGNLDYTTNYMRVNSLQNDMNFGIIIGDTTSSYPSFSGNGIRETRLTDYNLSRPIPKVYDSIDNYDAMPTTVTLSTGREVSLTISRRFYVNNPNGISIDDLGLAATSVTSGASTSNSFLICRDLIDRQTFPPDSVIKVSIKFTLKIGGGFLANFLKILYSYFANTSVNAIDVTNPPTEPVVTFSGNSLGWKLVIGSSTSPIVPEQISIDKPIAITSSHNKIETSTASNTIAYITMKSSFDNTFTETFHIRQLATLFTYDNKEYLVNLINVSGKGSDAIILAPEKLYRAIHSLGFKKDVTLPNVNEL